MDVGLHHWFKSFWLKLLLILLQVNETCDIIVSLLTIVCDILVVLMPYDILNLTSRSLGN